MTKTTEEKREIQAKRLQECMDLAGKKQSDLIRLTKHRYDIEIKSGHLSMILSADRSLPDDYAEYFSEILDVDYGYLIGSDLFVADSYADYLTINGTIETMSDQLDSDLIELRKYNYYLLPCGYKAIEATFTPEGKPTEYRIAHNGNEAMISASEMQKFKKAIDEQIRLRMDALMARYSI